MYTLFVLLSVVVAVLLALVVLVQESKGGGLASNVSGANSVLGVRKTTDFVEKSTWVLAALLVVFTVVASLFARQSAPSATQTITNMTEAPAALPTAPAQPGATPAATAPTAPAQPATSAPAAAQ